MLRCRGYIFFGSTLKILNDVMGSVVLPPELQPTLGKHKSSVGSSCASLDSQPGGGMGSSTGSVSASPGGPPKPTKFVLFDFSAVSGLDATAARSCFLNLQRTLAPGGVTLVFGGVPKDGRVERLLVGHEILGDTSTAQRFDTIDEALEFCEEQLLAMDEQAAAIAAAANAPHGQQRASLSRVLAPLVEPAWRGMLDGLAPFFEERRYANGAKIFRRGESARCIYFIVSGEVTLYEVAQPGATDRASARLVTPIAVGSHPATAARRASEASRRLVRYVNGGIFGELDFFLRHPRSFYAYATSDNCVILQLTRERLESMQAQASQLAAALEHAVLKYLCFQVNNKLGLADGVADVRAPGCRSD
jgi:SulP family sulfate permease